MQTQQAKGVPSDLTQADVKTCLHEFNRHKRSPLSVIDIQEKTDLPRWRVIAACDILQSGEQPAITRVSMQQHGTFRLNIPERPSLVVVHSAPTTDSETEVKTEAHDEAVVTTAPSGSIKTGDSGRTKTERILEAVKAFPGITPNEAGILLDLDPNHCSATLCNLHNKKRVQRQVIFFENRKRYKYYDPSVAVEDMVANVDPPANKPTKQSDVEVSVPETKTEEPTTPPTPPPQLPVVAAVQQPSLVAPPVSIPGPALDSPPHTAPTYGKAELLAIRSVLARVGHMLTSYDIELFNELIPGLEYQNRT